MHIFIPCGLSYNLMLSSWTAVLKVEIVLFKWLGVVFSIQVMTLTNACFQCLKF